MQQPAEIGVQQSPKIDERISDAQLTIDERAKGDEKEAEQRLHPEKRITEPIPLLSFAEHDLPAHHRHGEQAETRAYRKAACFLRIATRSSFR